MSGSWEHFVWSSVTTLLCIMLQSVCLGCCISDFKPSPFSFPGFQSTRALYLPSHEQSHLWNYSFLRLLSPCHSFQVKRLKVAHMHFPKCNRFDRNIQSCDGCRGEHTLRERRERTFADEAPSVLYQVAKLSTVAVVYIEKTRYRKYRILDRAWQSAVPGRLGRKNYTESRQGEAV